MTPEEKQQLDDLNRRVSAIEGSSGEQVIGYVPSGSNYKLTSTGSRDPGHVHIFPERTNITYTTYFESFDGWSTVGTPVAYLGGALFQTTTTINTEVDALNEQTISDIDWAKNSGFQTVLRTSATTDQTIYFGLGDLIVGDGTQEGYGFKITNGTLYALATQSDGASASETTVNITGSISLTSVNSYRAVKNGSAITYYVNDVGVTTITTGLPNGTSPTILCFYIKNTAAANKALYVASATANRQL